LHAQEAVLQEAMRAVRADYREVQRRAGLLLMHITHSSVLPPSPCSLLYMQEAVLQEAVQAFRADFQEAQRRAGLLEAEVATFFGRGGGGGGGGDAGTPIADIGECVLGLGFS